MLNDMNSGQIQRSNQDALDMVSTLTKKVLESVTRDKNDILYKPSNPSEIEEFYNTVNIEIDNKLNKALLGATIGV